MITSVTNPPPMYMISLPCWNLPGPRSVVVAVPATPKTKKADVAEHPQVFDHVGLLANEPIGAAELLSI
jgi:hypothetical protein